MTFTWPYALALLLLVPLIVAVHLWLLRRRRFVVSFASLSLIREALPARPRWRRRVPLALLLLALISLGVAAARPHAVVAVPLSRTSVILAIDVSRSMCATDVAPNRLSVAQDVARAFIADQPDDTRIGIVAFSGLAQLVVPLTTDRELLREAIDGFTAGRGTAVGTALLRAIDAIAEFNPDVTRSGVDVRALGERAADAGEYEPDIVVLLTDGATTQGVDPLRAAEQAADRRIRVYTIGFGTDQVATLVCSREQLGSDVFGGQFGGGGPGPGGGGGGGGGDAQRRPFLVRDETTLESVAEITGGSYHRAEDADALEQVFENLPTEVVIQDEQRELSFVFAGLGALLATAAVGLSLAWNRTT